MQTIQASEAKTKFLSILDEVERGAIARIVPDDAVLAASDTARRERTLAAIRSIEELRKKVGKMSLAEIIDAKNEGRM